MALKVRVTGNSLPCIHASHRDVPCRQVRYSKIYSFIHVLGHGMVVAHLQSYTPLHPDLLWLFPPYTPVLTSAVAVSFPHSSFPHADHVASPHYCVATELTSLCFLKTEKVENAMFCSNHRFTVTTTRPPSCIQRHMLRDLEMYRR